MKFEDKIVLVTGASQNTGVEIARRFLEAGAHVVINSDDEANLNVVADRFEAAFPGRILSVVADIGDEEAVRDMFVNIDQVFGRIDILINNACNQGIGPTFDEMLLSDFIDVIRVNLIGTFLVSQYAVVRMLKQEGRGVIVNLSSNVSKRAIHKRAAYVTSKSGIDGLTKAMAIDLGPKGIRVNAVAPGYIYTSRWDILPESVKQRRRMNIPLGIESVGEDIADAVLFLASSESRTINGARLVVDGGCTAQHMPEDIDF